MRAADNETWFFSIIIFYQVWNVIIEKKPCFWTFQVSFMKFYRNFAMIITLYFFLLCEKLSIENSDSSSCWISSKRTKYIMVVRVYHHLGLMTSYVCFSGRMVLTYMILVPLQNVYGILIYFNFSIVVVKILIER